MLVAEVPQGPPPPEWQGPPMSLVTTPVLYEMTAKYTTEEKHYGYKYEKKRFY